MFPRGLWKIIIFEDMFSTWIYIRSCFIFIFTTMSFQYYPNNWTLIYISVTKCLPLVNFLYFYVNDTIFNHHILIILLHFWRRGILSHMNLFKKTLSRPITHDRPWKISTFPKDHYAWSAEETFFQYVLVIPKLSLLNYQKILKKYFLLTGHS